MIRARLVAVVALLLCMTARADDPHKRWLQLDTTHFHIVYYVFPDGTGEEQIAQRLAVVAERVHERLVPFMGPGLSEPRKTWIVLTDTVDDYNGSATVQPYPVVRLNGVTPDDRTEHNDWDDYLYDLFLHEYTHILHIGTWDSVCAKLVNALLGWGVGIVYPPNQAQPRFLIEGLAVYEETARTSGGRLRSSIWDMYLRAQTLENRFQRLSQFTHAPIQFPYANSAYLYGSAFMRFVADRYGEQTLRLDYENYGNNCLPGGDQPQPEAGHAEDLGRALSRLQALAAGPLRRAARRDRQARHHADAHPAERRARERRASGVHARRQRDPLHRQRRLRAAGDPPHGPGHRQGAQRAQGRRRRRAEHHRRRRHARLFGVGGRGARTTSSTMSTTTIASTHQTTPTHRRVARDQPEHLARRDQGRLRGERQHGARLIHDRSDRPGRQTELIPPTQFEVAYTPVFSPDGKTIAFSWWREGGYRDIWTMDLASRALTRITADRAIDMEPRWSPDGKYLYFVSDRTGVYNLYARESETGKLWQVSNVVNGLLRSRHLARRKRAVMVGFQAEGYRLELMDLDPARWWEAAPALLDRVDVPTERVQTPMTPQALSPVVDAVPLDVHHLRAARRVRRNPRASSCTAPTWSGITRGT